MTDQRLVLAYLDDYLDATDHEFPVEPYPEDPEDRILLGYAEALGRAHRLQGATPMDRRDVVPLIRGKAQEGHTIEVRATAPDADRLHEIIAEAGRNLDGR